MDTRKKSPWQYLVIRKLKGRPVEILHKSRHFERAHAAYVAAIGPDTALGRRGLRLIAARRRPDDSWETRDHSESWDALVAAPLRATQAASRPQPSVEAPAQSLRQVQAASANEPGETPGQGDGTGARWMRRLAFAASLAFAAILPWLPFPNAGSEAAVRPPRAETSARPEIAPTDSRDLTRLAGLHHRFSAAAPADRNAGCTWQGPDRRTCQVNLPAALAWSAGDGIAYADEVRHDGQWHLSSLSWDWRQMRSGAAGAGLETAQVFDQFVEETTKVFGPPALHQSAARTKSAAIEASPVLETAGRYALWQDRESGIVLYAAQMASLGQKAPSVQFRAFPTTPAPAPTP
ncbi:MAG: hypothetical protein ACPGNT_00335 [Rhodospirillales bacterium]